MKKQLKNYPGGNDRGPDKQHVKLLQINILQSFNFYYNITHKKNKELIIFKLRGSILETCKRSPSIYLTNAIIESIFISLFKLYV